MGDEVWNSKEADLTLEGGNYVAKHMPEQISGRIKIAAKYICEKMTLDKFQSEYFHDVLKTNEILDTTSKFYPLENLKSPDGVTPHHLHVTMPRFTMMSNRSSIVVHFDIDDKENKKKT